MQLRLFHFMFVKCCFEHAQLRSILRYLSKTLELGEGGPAGCGVVDGGIAVGRSAATEGRHCPVGHGSGRCRGSQRCR